MRGDEWIEAMKRERSTDLAEHIANEAGVHRAHEHLIGVDEVVESAWGEFEREGVLVDHGLETDIIEMLVQHIELRDGGVDLGLRGSERRAQQRAAPSRRGDAFARGGVRRCLSHRVEDQGWTAAPAGSPGLAADEALDLEHAQVIAGRVQRDLAFIRQLIRAAAGFPLDGTEQSHATRLGETAEVSDTSRHAAIIGEDDRHVLGELLVGGSTRSGPANFSGANGWRVGSPRRQTRSDASANGKEHHAALTGV